MSPSILRRLVPPALTLAALAPGAAAAEVAVSLSDLLGGGNGCGTSAAGDGASPRSGIKVTIDSFAGAGAVGGKFFATDGTGSKAALPYVDGVFSIDGETRVATSGLKYAFPATGGGATLDALRRDVAAVLPGDLVVAIELLDQPGVARPGLGVPANSGITFDLAALGAALGFGAPLRVEAVAGITASSAAGSIETFALVDGALLATTTIVQSGAAHPLVAALAPGSRFLTLAATDHGDGNGGDLAVFADARVVFAGPFPDCNGNSVADFCEIATGVASDCDLDARPDDCEWQVLPYGEGCAGPGGLVPTAGIHGCVAPNTYLYAWLHGAEAKTVAFALVGPAEGASPLMPGSACEFLLAGPLTVAAVIPTGDALPTATWHLVASYLPAGLPPHTSLFAQFVVARKDLPGQYAATRGFEVRTFETN
jgi:hypothetical protein